MSQSPEQIRKLASAAISWYTLLHIQAISLMLVRYFNPFCSQFFHTNTQQLQGIRFVIISISVRQQYDLKRSLFRLQSQPVFQDHIYISYSILVFS